MKSTLEGHIIIAGRDDTKERDEVMQRSLIALGTVSELRQKAGGKEINLEAVFLKLTEDF